MLFPRIPKSDIILSFRFVNSVSDQATGAC
jgi:hypothetical protein